MIRSLSLVVNGFSSVKKIALKAFVPKWNYAASWGPAFREFQAKKQSSGVRFVAVCYGINPVDD